VSNLDKPRMKGISLPLSSLVGWMLCAVAVLAATVSLQSASFGIEFHHDYFSVISGYLQSIGLTPHSEAYNHYGVVDSTLKELIIRLGGNLLSIKAAYVVFNMATCLFLVFSFRDKRIRITISCMCLLWFVSDPAMLGIKDFSPFLGTISPPDSKLSKLAWPSDLTNLFSSLWIFISLSTFRHTKNYSSDQIITFLVYGFFSGLLCAATWLSKFTIGGSFFAAVLISAALVTVLFKDKALICRFCVGFAVGTVLLPVIFIIRHQTFDQRFISSYLYQTFTIQRDFFDVNAGPESFIRLIGLYVSILKEKLFLEGRIWGLVSFFVATLFVFSISKRGDILSRSPGLVCFSVISGLVGFYGYKDLGHSLDTVQILVSFMFIINLFMTLLNLDHYRRILLAGFQPGIPLYRKELLLGVIFICPVAYLSLTQIAPLGDQFHIWLSSAFLMSLAGLQLLFYLEYKRIESKTILYCFLQAILIFILLQLNHSSKELAQMRRDESRFVKLGSEFGLLKGMHVDNNNSQGRILASFQPRGNALYVVKGHDALPELFSSKEKYRSWNQCLGAPYNIVYRIRSGNNPYIDNVQKCIDIHNPIVLTD